MQVAKRLTARVITVSGCSPVTSWQSNSTWFKLHKSHIFRHLKKTKTVLGFVPSLVGQTLERCCFNCSTFIRTSKVTKNVRKIVGPFFPSSWLQHAATICQNRGLTWIKIKALLGIADQASWYMIKVMHPKRSKKQTLHKNTQYNLFLYMNLSIKILQARHNFRFEAATGQQNPTNYTYLRIINRSYWRYLRLHPTTNHPNGNFRILKWRYVSTICLAIFSGDIPLHRPKK